MLSPSGNAPSAATGAGSVEALIAQFDANPFTTSRSLRQLRDADPGRFQEFALRSIAELPENPGIRFVATLVPLSEPILELIANPKAFSEDSARRIVEVMRRVDSQTEAKLLRLITGNPSNPLPSQMIDRILDLVDAVSDSPRLVPVLMQIFRSADSYSRARLSLSIGKHHRNKDWIEDRMRDTDPRVRANAVAANWLQKDDAALTLFAAALRDPHHRVIGNGAVGLYYAGDLRSLRVFGELLANQDPNWRAAGLWGIGHVQDTRFKGQIARLSEDRDMIVRRSLIVAQARLERVIEIRGEQPKLQLRLIKATRQPLPQTSEEGPLKFHNHVFLEVKNVEGTVAVHGLKGLAFHIFENDQAILDYSVQERTSYVKPGTYDIYFAADRIAGQTAQGRHLKVVVLTDSASAQYDSFDGDEAALEMVSEAQAAPVHTWDAFR